MKKIAILRKYLKDQKKNAVFQFLTPFSLDLGIQNILVSILNMILPTMLIEYFLVRFIIDFLLEISVKNCSVYLYSKCYFFLNLIKT